MGKPPRITIPLFDLNQPEEEPTFQDFNREWDNESWRGRGSLAELPEGTGIYGAGGNADGSGDPYDTYVENHHGSLIVGPDSPLGKKGNARK